LSNPLNYLHYIIITVLYIIQVQPIGWLMKKLTRRWREEIVVPGEERDSLASAGLWIGALERLLIVTFVLMHEYSAIGFLIGAKSLLRFGDASKSNARKQSEYILIGTLLSFCFAMFTSLLAIKLADYLM
jgi:hypothetical protein